MKQVFFVGFILVAVSLAMAIGGSNQRLDGIWVGNESVSLTPRTDCPSPSYGKTLPARIAIAQGGTMLAVADGYGPGRYTNIHWSGDTLVFEIANKRKGELHLSADGKTLIEKGSIRRTTTVTSGQRSGAASGKPPEVTGFTACVDEISGTFQRSQ